mgnify:CR=1 FL=1
MNRARRMLCRLCCDDSGGEVMEYAIVGALVVIGAIALISLVGGKVVQNWTVVQTGW